MTGSTGGFCSMISPSPHPVVDRATGALQDFVVDPLYPELADADVSIEVWALGEIGLLRQTEMTDDMSHCVTRRGRPVPGP